VSDVAAHWTSILSSLRLCAVPRGLRRGRAAVGTSLPTTRGVRSLSRAGCGGRRAAAS
jgi:hypothetical protein